jgi:hypothetical protein
MVVWGRLSEYSGEATSAPYMSSLASFRIAHQEIDSQPPLKILSSCLCDSGHAFGRERDGVAELLEPANMGTLQLRLFQLVEVVGS